MADGEPRWRRRKTARPGEILEAALAVFADKGFAAARLSDIAAKAGVSKAALYVYFETKTDLFRAVANQVAAPNIERLRPLVDGEPGRFAEMMPVILSGIAKVAEDMPLGGIAKMVIGESRNFPEIASVWREAVIERALSMIVQLVEQAQKKGEVRAGDPRLYGLSLLGPMIMGVLWTEVAVPAGGAPIDLHKLAAQHAGVLMDGMLVEARR